MTKSQKTPKITLNIGDVFNTSFERGCVVTTIPDVWGNFEATDSDGVLCAFSVSMVESIDPKN